MAKIDEKHIRERIIRCREGKTTSGKEMKSWASVVGQRIGDILQIVMDISFEEFTKLKDIQLESIGGGKEKILTGDSKQIDGRLVNIRGELITIGESKWLKDQRHQNDKGAWITGLPDDMCKANPTIKGVIAILAGPWIGTPSHNRMIEQGTKTVIISLDDMIKFLHDIGLTTYEIESDGNTLVDPKRVTLQFCELEEKLLDKGLNPYNFWAKKILDEVKTEGKDTTVREEIGKFLSEINSRKSPVGNIVVNGFTLMVETNIGSLEIKKIGIGGSLGLGILKTIRAWKKKPQAMYNILIDEEIELQIEDIQE